jgi:ectoine hydroxylase-related dioxygenase (phytanoyl-CoA dioxygenase family)
MINVQLFEERGFAMTAPLFPSSDLHRLIHLIESSSQTTPARRGGRRDVMDLIPELRALAQHPAVRAIAEQVLGPEAHVVRSTLFDKTDAANWKVPWHQDVTIAVSERRETPGYGPWSMKSGVLHVQPPSEVLERMVTIRIHLDPCPSTNGPLRVLPGTHRLGRINQNYVEKYIDEAQTVTCEAEPGEALVMRPLLLHASSPAESPTHRRVVHLDFAAASLTNGLTWHIR